MFKGIFKYQIPDHLKMWDETNDEFKRRVKEGLTVSQEPKDFEINYDRTNPEE